MCLSFYRSWLHFPYSGLKFFFCTMALNDLYFNHALSYSALCGLLFFLDSYSVLSLGTRMITYLTTLIYVWMDGILLICLASCFMRWILDQRYGWIFDWEELAYRWKGCMKNEVLDTPFVIYYSHTVKFFGNVHIAGKIY